MAHPNEDVVRETFAAFGRGDVDAAQKHWAEDIRFHVPGRNPRAGDYEGIEQVRQFYAGLAEDVTGGTVSSELHDVLANDEHAVVLMTIRRERAGKQWDDNTVVVYHIRNGKITEVWSHATDQYAVDEFLS
jgi:ketosteroid isomerase-like protein